MIQYFQVVIISTFYCFVISCIPNMTVAANSLEQSMQDMVTYKIRDVAVVAIDGVNKDNQVFICYSDGLIQEINARTHAVTRSIRLPFDKVVRISSKTESIFIVIGEPSNNDNKGQYVLAEIKLGDGDPDVKLISDIEESGLATPDVLLSQNLAVIPINDTKIGVFDLRHGRSATIEHRLKTIRSIASGSSLDNIVLSGIDHEDKSVILRYRIDDATFDSELLSIFQTNTIVIACILFEGRLVAQEISGNLLLLQIDDDNIKRLNEHNLPGRAVCFIHDGRRVYASIIGNSPNFSTFAQSYIAALDMQGMQWIRVQHSPIFNSHTLFFHSIVNRIVAGGSDGTLLFLPVAK